MFDIPKDLKGSHDKFRNAALNTLQTNLNKIITEHREEWVNVTVNIIMNDSGPRHLKRDLDSREIALSKVLDGFLEIEASFNALNEVPFYLQRFPAKIPSKSKYLELVITGYLNEFYILSKRLEAYTKKITRLYKTSLHSEMKIDVLIEYDEILNKIFYNINTIRGLHVHKNRFLDDDLQRLTYLEIQIRDQSALSKLVRPIYKKALVENKRKWLQLFQVENAKLQQILDLYFAGLYVVIFDNKGNFINPK